MVFAHAWQGNVRELAHPLRFATAHSENTITDDHLPESVRSPAPISSASPTKPADEREQLVARLAEHAGNISAVARVLETSRTQVKRLMERHGLQDVS